MSDCTNHRITHIAAACTRLWAGHDERYVTIDTLAILDRIQECMVHCGQVEVVKALLSRKQHVAHPALLLGGGAARWQVRGEIAQLRPERHHVDAVQHPRSMLARAPALPVAAEAQRACAGHVVVHLERHHRVKGATETGAGRVCSHRDVEETVPTEDRP